MNVQLFPARLAGTVAAIPSKSDAHRALICAALADQPTRLILDGELSEDMHATGRCLAALGGTIRTASGGVEVSPIREVPEAPLLDCGESGSTLRFILPVAASLCDGFSMIGRGRLPERPLGALCTAMEAGGCTFSAHALPLSVSGRLTSGEYALPGNISSQYISGLLLAFPMLPQESRIRLTAPLESSGYVAMTLSVMRRFGADAQWCADGFRCSGGGYVSPGALEIEGDWSNAAFWLAARSLGHALTVTGLCNTSSQPDRQAGALVDALGGGAEVDVSECPDLLPILAVRAAYAGGETHFLHAARLRLKESDRLHAAAEGLALLGADVSEMPDALVVCGHGGLRGECAVSSYGDHRMAMAWAIAALDADGPVTILGAEAVNKSYPAFWREYQRLGGKCNVL